MLLNILNKIHLTVATIAAYETGFSGFSTYYA